MIYWGSQKRVNEGKKKANSNIPTEHSIPIWVVQKLNNELINSRVFQTLSCAGNSPMAFMWQISIFTLRIQKIRFRKILVPHIATGRNLVCLVPAMVLFHIALRCFQSCSRWNTQIATVSTRRTDFILLRISKKKRSVHRFIICFGATSNSVQILLLAWETMWCHISYLGWLLARQMPYPQTISLAPSSSLSEMKWDLARMWIPRRRPWSSSRFISKIPKWFPKISKIPSFQKSKNDFH